MSTAATVDPLTGRNPSAFYFPIALFFGMSAYEWYLGAKMLLSVAYKFKATPDKLKKPTFVFSALYVLSNAISVVGYMCLYDWRAYPYATPSNPFWRQAMVLLITVADASVSFCLVYLVL